MAYTSLRDYLAALEPDGLFTRVAEPVSSYLELTEIGTRLIAQGGPAVLFENVTNEHGQQAEMPALINLFGTVERVARAVTLGGTPRKTAKDLREVGELLAYLRQPEPPRGVVDALKMTPLVKTIMMMRPKTVKKAPCQEVVLLGKDADLDRLPIQTCWPGEPAPLITWPLIVTQGPGDAAQDKPNLGIYRMQKLGKHQTLMRWLATRGGAQQFARFKAAYPGRPMPLAAVIGADPGTILAAVTPVPDTLSEYQFAGLLRGAKVELVNCKTVPLQVPAQAEIIIEGFVDPEATLPEGPYGDHTGYYNSVEQFPVFNVSAITMRRDPMYLTTYTGKPPDEPSVLGEALNEVFVPLIAQAFPEITDFWLPPEACSYRIAVISMKKAYAGHAKRVMMGAWSYLRQFTYTKWLIVVDDDIDARNWKEVMWAISTRMDPVRDCVPVENTPIDYLDFASPVSGLGSKMGLDATNKWPGETTREWGTQIAMSEQVIADVTAKWGKLGL
ncbi:MAG: UbiD family decarboxylase [Robiginitomaculum sp.]|nr:UbiD family decarboxylase [Robiginitomaculum sp.]